MRLSITQKDLGDQALDNEDHVIKSLSECNPASLGLRLSRKLPQLDAEMRSGTRTEASHTRGW